MGKLDSNGRSSLLCVVQLLRQLPCWEKRLAGCSANSAHSSRYCNKPTHPTAYSLLTQESIPIFLACATTIWCAWWYVISLGFPIKAVYIKLWPVIFLYKFSRQSRKAPWPNLLNKEHYSDGKNYWNLFTNSRM